jgi:hydroxymethylbilane synthase
MAIEIRSERTDLQQWLAPLNHLTTAQAVAAERAVSKTFGGSCQIPLAAFATHEDPNGNTMRLRAMVATPDGRRIATADASGPAHAPEELGRQIAKALQAQDATAILAACNVDGKADA